LAAQLHPDPLGSLLRFFRPLAGFGGTVRDWFGRGGREARGTEGKGKGGEGKEMKAEEEMEGKRGGVSYWHFFFSHCKPCLSVKWRLSNVYKTRRVLSFEPLRCKCQ